MVSQTLERILQMNSKIGSLSLACCLLTAGVLSACGSGTDWSFIDNLESSDCSETVSYSELVKFATSDLDGQCLSFQCEVFQADDPDRIGCYFEKGLGDFTAVFAKTESTKAMMRPILEDEVYRMTAVVDGNYTGKNGFGGEVSYPRLILVSAEFAGLAD